MLTLHILSQNLRSYQFLPRLEAIITHLSLLLRAQAPAMPETILFCDIDLLHCTK
jgi:hypothetical protein